MKMNSSGRVPKLIHSKYDQERSFPIFSFRIEKFQWIEVGQLSDLKSWYFNEKMNNSQYLIIFFAPVDQETIIVFRSSQ